MDLNLEVLQNFLVVAVGWLDNFHKILFLWKIRS